MIGDGLRKCRLVQLPDGGRQDPLMRRGQYIPGLQGDPEAVKQAEVTLICRDENPLLLGCVFEVKGIVSAPQAELHGSGNIMALLYEEWSERQGYTFIQVETGHALLDEQIIALDPLLDFCLVPLVVTERSLEFFFS